MPGSIVQPKAMAREAPTLAAAETQRVNGSASGLPRIVCMPAPARPSMAPTEPPSAAIGRRRSKITTCRPRIGGKPIPVQGGEARRGSVAGPGPDRKIEGERRDEERGAPRRDERGCAAARPADRKQARDRRREHVTSARPRTHPDGATGRNFACSSCHVPLRSTSFETGRDASYLRNRLHGDERIGRVVVLMVERHDALLLRGAQQRDARAAPSASLSRACTTFAGVAS